MRSIVFKAFFVGVVLGVFMAITIMIACVINYFLLPLFGLEFTLLPYFKYASIASAAAGGVTTLLWFLWLLFLARKFFFKIIKEHLLPGEKQ